MDLKFWHKALREADASLMPRPHARRWTPPRKLMRAKTELKRLEAEISV